MELTYLVNKYPRGSLSFIRCEMQAPKRAGHTIHRFAMRSDRTALVDTADLAEDCRTERVLEQGLRCFLPRALGWMARHPSQTIADLRLAVGCGKRFVRGEPGT